MSDSASAQQDRNPFLPGAGSPPPFLAGRHEDLAVFSDCFERLKDGSPAAGPMVLFGPRGGGKTVLLGAMHGIAAEEGSEAVFARLSPRRARTAEDLVSVLESVLTKGKAPLETEMTAGGDVGVRGIASAKGEFTKRLDASAKQVSDVLVRHAAKRPLVIAVDEAHGLTPGAGGALLEGEQTARRMGAGVQLLLAGTPDLKDRMIGMDASFWDRLSKRLRHINLLDEDASAEAVEKPFQDAFGVSLDAEAKGRIFELTSGYPYFLQLMGEALWDGREGAAKTITRGQVDAAESSFLAGKDAYYQMRHEELVLAGMLGPAFAVVVAHQKTEGEALTFQKLPKIAQAGASLDMDVEGIAGAPDTPMDRGRFLRHKGFAWASSPTSRRLVPGIPTLMDYVREQVLAEFPDAEGCLLRDRRFRKLIDGVAHTPA